MNLSRKQTLTYVGPPTFAPVFVGTKQPSSFYRPRRRKVAIPVHGHSTGLSDYIPPTSKTPQAEKKAFGYIHIANVHLYIPSGDTE